MKNGRDHVEKHGRSEDRRDISVVTVRVDAWIAEGLVFKSP